MPADQPEPAGPAPDPDLDPAAATGRQELADLLTRLRERAGLTVRDVAKATGLPHSTIGGYLSGRHLPPVAQPETLPRILRACGVTDPETIRQWCAALDRLRRLPGPRPADSAAPYRGLSSFQPEHAEWFFGRRRLTADVLTQVAECARSGDGPVVLVGPSGSGKSSLLRAGLIPALRSDAVPWRVALLTPGRQPLHALREQLTNHSGPLAVVVDQFEEVFTECTDDRERQEFFAALRSLAGPGTGTAGEPAVAVLGLRADFYDRALRQPQLVEPLQRWQVAIGPMTEEDLREAIVAPARKAGLDVEDGLVEVLLRDLAPPDGDGAHEAGALPLLSHALHATWQRGARWRMALADYQATGGVRGAVAGTADAVFESLTPAERALARRLFVRLVHVGDGTPNTRRRVPREELRQLDDGPAGVDQLLDRFVDQRLITVDAGTVQLAHESLVAAWPRLRAWIEADRRELLVAQQVEEAARQWRQEGRDPAALWRGGRLAAARELPGTALTAAGREFRQASAHRERRRVRVLYQAIAGLAALLTLAVAGGGFALQQRGEAVAQRAAAAEERNLALSRMVAVRADRLRESDPALAAQLALVAYRTAPTVAARSSLLSTGGMPVATRLVGPDAIMQDLVLEPGAGVLAAASDDSASVWLWDVSEPHRPSVVARDLPGLDGVINALALHGRLLVAAGSTGEIFMYDIDGPVRLVARLTGPEDAVNGLALSPDGQTLAAGTEGGEVWLWRVVDPASAVPTGQALVAAPAAPAAVNSVAFSPDGRTVAAGDEDGALHRWDLSEPGAPARLGRSLAGSDLTLYSVAFSPDGQLVAAASADENVYLWPTAPVADPDATAPAPEAALTAPSGSGWVHSVAFSPDGRTVAAGSGDGRARLWHVDTGQLAGVMPHPGPVTGLAFEPGGEAVYAAAADGVVRRWALPGPVLTGTGDTVFDLVRPPHRPILVAASGDGHLYLWDTSDPHRPAPLGVPLASPDSDSELVGTVGASPDGETLVASGRDGTIWRWDITDPRRPEPLDPPLTGLSALAESLVFSPDGQVLAVGGRDGTVQLWDVADPRHPRRLAAMTEGWGNVYSIAFSPDGRTLAAGAVDRLVWLWDVSRPDRPRLLGEPLSGPASYVYSVAFSPDGGTLAAASADKTVRLWDVDDPAAPAPGPVLTGANGYMLWVAFSPDGETLAAASRDSTVWIWQVDGMAEPEVRAVLTGHEGGVNMLAYRPDGGLLASSSSDTTVRLWPTEPAEVAAQVCATAGDPVTRSEWERHVPGLPYQPPCDA